MKDPNDYTNWLFNQFVQYTISPLGHNERMAADLAFQALMNHLECNLQGKGKGFARTVARDRIKEIRQYQTERNRYKLDYVGEAAEKLRNRDRQLREISKVYSTDERISASGSRTDLYALKWIGRVVQSADKLRPIPMTRMDDAHVCGALNMLLRVLQANGYELSEDKKKVVRKLD